MGWWGSSLALWKGARVFVLATETPHPRQVSNWLYGDVLYLSRSSQWTSRKVYKYQTQLNSLKLFLIYILLLLFYCKTFVWDRGAINLLLIWVQLYYLFINFGLFTKNFSPAGIVVRRPSVPHYQLVLLQSCCRFMLISLTKVIILVYTKYHAVRDHSLCFLHRLIDVRLSVSSSLLFRIKFWPQD